MLPCMYCGCRAGYTCLPTYLSTKVHFYASGRNEGEIAGAFVENYLLEKSRVVGACAAGRGHTHYDFYTSTTYYGHTDSPGKSQQGERSYHIFYQLAISQIWAPALSLQPAEAYRYLASCTKVLGILPNPDPNRNPNLLLTLTPTRRCLASTTPRTSKR